MSFIYVGSVLIINRRGSCALGIYILFCLVQATIFSIENSNPSHYNTDVVICEEL